MDLMDIEPDTAPARATARSTAAKRRILIVDDEADFTLMAGMTLEQTGRYETRQENDPRQTVAAARAFRPDVILLDVMMPDMDGGDVLAELRAGPDTRAIPVIFLTALVGSGEATAGSLPSGGHCFVPKATPVAELVDRIEDALSQP